MQSHSQGAGRLTTHVLDTARGKPAEGLRIDLYRVEGDTFHHIKTTQTNDDGRCDAPLLSGETMKAGNYELRFHAGDYLGRTGDGPMFLDIIPIRPISQPAVCMAATCAGERLSAVATP